MSNLVNYKDRSVSDGYDICIWSGDFNYRINLDLNQITKYLVKKDNRYNISELVKFDQMNNEKKIGNLFINNFLEGEINFLPTYKLITGTSDYVLEEGGEKRPGWTDRILLI